MQVKNENDRRKQDLDKELSQSVAVYWDESGYSGIHNNDAGNKGTNGRTRDVYTEQSQSNGDGNTGKSEVNSRPKRPN